METAMPTLPNKLQAQTAFERHELNHVLLMMYNILNRALRDDADTLHFEEPAIRWSRAGNDLGQFDLSMLPTPAAFHAAFTLMCDRDADVRAHVRPVESVTPRYQLA